MNLLDVIAESYGGRGIQVLGQKFGLTERQTRAAIDQLAPAVMAGLRREIQSPEGVSKLLSALATGNHGRYLDRDDDRIVDDGNAILGHVFKSKEVSRGVADKAAAASGVTPDVLRKMLPVVSAMVMGALSKQVIGDRPPATTATPLRGGGAAERLKSRARAVSDASGDDAGARNVGGRARVASQSVKGARAPAATRAPEAAPATAAHAPDMGGLGGILGQLLGGQPAAGSGAASGGGGIGDILGQLLGQGGGRSTGGGGGGLGDVLGGLFGANASPQVRDQATQSIGGLLSSLLGGGTPQGKSADDLLDSVARRR